MVAIFINCKDQPFIRKIFDRDKLFETRTRNMLKRFAGQRVLLVETGNGAPMIRGSARCGVGCPVTSAEQWDAIRTTTQVPAGSKYDWKDDTKIKWLYPMFNPVECEPLPLPADAVRHGRTWAELPDDHDFCLL